MEMRTRAIRLRIEFSGKAVIALPVQNEKGFVSTN
jgi:hypothetical protein